MLEMTGWRQVTPERGTNTRQLLIHNIKHSASVKLVYSAISFTLFRGPLVREEATGEVWADSVFSGELLRKQRGISKPVCVSLAPSWKGEPPVLHIGRVCAKIQQVKRPWQNQLSNIPKTKSICFTDMLYANHSNMPSLEDALSPLRACCSRWWGSTAFCQGCQWKHYQCFFLFLTSSYTQA